MEQQQIIDSISGQLNKLFFEEDCLNDYSVAGISTWQDGRGYLIKTVSPNGNFNIAIFDSGIIRYKPTSVYADIFKRIAEKYGLRIYLTDNLMFSKKRIPAPRIDLVNHIKITGSNARIGVQF